MCGVGRLQVHGIRSHRLVCKDVVEARSSYKKSYFWWFGNPACGDSSGSNWIDKYQDRVSLDLFEARGEKGLCVWCAIRWLGYYWATNFSQIRIWNPIGSLCSSFLAETVKRVKAADCFRKGAPSLMFDRILMRLCLRRRFLSMWLHKKISNPPNSLDSHQTQKQ